MILAGVRIIPAMHGLHLTADLQGCPVAQPAMVSPAALEALCRAAVAEVGLHAVGGLFHGFPAREGSGEPSGVTGVVLLAESHVAIHTWPELGAVTLDVYVCNVGQNNEARARQLLADVCAAFAPTHTHVQALRRGHLGVDASQALTAGGCLSCANLAAPSKGTP